MECECRQYAPPIFMVADKRERPDAVSQRHGDLGPGMFCDNHFLTTNNKNLLNSPISNSSLVSSRYVL